MEPLASAAIAEWNKRLTASSSAQQGLIAVAFDQRNHGTRLVDSVANEAWRSGNPRHAQDMFSCFHGTALDTSQLITYLPAYVYPDSERRITSHMVIGVSLGGHAAWHCLLHEPRITTAVSVIGCADYTSLMVQRAEKSKLETWKGSNPPGATFLGSKDFPKALQDAIRKYDPAGLLLGEMVQARTDVHVPDPDDAEKKRLVPLMRDRLRGKRIFAASGGADKLVPYACSAPFMTWLKRAVGRNGWFTGHEFVLKDVVYDGVGHDLTPAMMKDSIDFLVATLDDQGNAESKI